MEKYKAVFECPINGKFIVVCIGYFKRDKASDLFPTVDEAKEELSANATFIGLL